MTDVSEFHPLSYQMKNTLIPIVLFVSILITGLSDLYENFPPQMSLESPQDAGISAPEAETDRQPEQGIFK